jgi:flavin reductase (DIM6/NTAB) family NADH-FMN oxidoreductase RutF
MEETLIANMRQMTYGIYVLTTRHKSTINGMIASWVSQVSFDPALLMVAVHPNRYSHGLISQSGHFALHSLAREQKDLLLRFKGPDPVAKFSTLAWHDGVSGCPILDDCIGCLECRVIQTLAPGNHTLFIGEVVNAEFNGEKAPLSTLDYEGCYLGKN